MTPKSVSPVGSQQPAPRAPRRKTKRVDPFSVWQIMVQDRCDDLGISTRALADKVASPRRRYEHTTIWAWLRSTEGTPPAETYTVDLNRRLAEAIQIKHDILAAAFDESRRKFMTSPAPGQQGQLSILRTLISNSPQKNWERDYIVKLIDDIRGI